MRVKCNRRNYCKLLGLAHAHAQPLEENFHSDSNSQLSSCDKEPVITDEMITEQKQSVSGEIIVTSPQNKT
ncbi:hypothetical protein J6590_019666 [Homalodisca vitripennis]|nr:hypothetical protein J6590_019666 [Homalodisca vitripennis]